MAAGKQLTPETADQSINPLSTAATETGKTRQLYRPQKGKKEEKGD